jgi:hypothetical protein
MSADASMAADPRWKHMHATHCSMYSDDSTAWFYVFFRRNVLFVHGQPSIRDVEEKASGLEIVGLSYQWSVLVRSELDS